MDLVIQLLVVLVIAGASLLSNKKKKADADRKKAGSTRTASSASRSYGRQTDYDPTAPLGSKRNPLGRPGTGTTVSDAAAHKHTSSGSIPGLSESGDDGSLGSFLKKNLSEKTGTFRDLAASRSSADTRRNKNGGTLSFDQIRGSNIFGFTRRAPGSAQADDGHRLSGVDDISCRQYGHVHPETDDMPRYIPHNDPEDGYIVLNGKMMRLSEADKYENTI